MLAGSLAMLAMVGTFVAFGSWPGATSGAHVDQVLLSAVTKPHAPEHVVVSAKARTVARVGHAVAGAQRSGANGSTTGRAPATTPVAQVPAAGGTGTATQSPTTAVQQPVKTVSNTVQNTTQTVTNQVQQQVQNVQTQVNQVVGQVGGTVTNTTTSPTSTVGGGTVQQVQDTAGSILGK